MRVAQPLSMSNAFSLSVRSFSSLYLQDLSSLQSGKISGTEDAAACGWLCTPVLCGGSNQWGDLVECTCMMVLILVVKSTL